MVEKIDREIIERDINKNSEWGNEQYSLACYHDFWSEGNIPHLGLYHTICVKDRSDCPSYLEYDSKYETFQSAVAELERKGEKKNKRFQLFKIFLGAIFSAIVGFALTIYHQEIISFITNIIKETLAFLSQFIS